MTGNPLYGSMGMIQALEERNLHAFFSYLNTQISDNGKDGAPLFQPQSRSQQGFPKGKETAFVEGLGIPVGDPKWRKAWVFLDEGGEIVGHIDLRARPELYTSHRALLGMGVVPAFRRKGIGLRLVEHALLWASTSNVVDTIDLEVLAQNKGAIQLYRKAGFDLLCRIDDMFRIDGQSEPYVLMTKKV